MLYMDSENSRVHISIARCKFVPLGWATLWQFFFFKLFEVENYYDFKTIIICRIIPS